MRRLAVLLFVLALPVLAAAKSFELRSPDGLYSMIIEDEDGGVRYSLDYGGKRVVNSSRLGVELYGESLYPARLDKIETGDEIDLVWRTVYGERSQIRDHYNQAEVYFESVPFYLEIRAYDEGVAFRYRFTGNKYLRITGELTEFSVEEGSLAYVTPRAQTEYSLLPLKDWPLEGEAERPLLIKLPDGGYLCLAEAGVVDYVRTKFSLSDKPSTIRTAMYGQVDEIAPYQTPWRLIMFGEKAGDILQNNSVFYNLNPPLEIDDTSWIKPGKVMREMTLSTEGAMKLVDFAAKRNIQYIHFDAGWYGHEYDKESDATTVTLDPKRNPDPNALDLPFVIQYARSKGVGVTLYVNQRALQAQLDEILPLYERWGVAGVKFGFVQVGSQVWTKWMHEAVRKCSEHHLMVDIHDEYRPTGFSRTYPNLMTQEGVRGNEEFPDARNNTLLPFTRFVCGPADYTICYYSLSRLKTTPAHQLALSVVYYSPLQFMYWYDKPSDSQDEPELKFFDDVYTVWDDTEVIEGEPGEFATIARRHGDEWFLGTITNQKRVAEIGLGFLPAGNYTAEIYTDGDETIPTRTRVKTARRKVSRKDILKFDLKDSGGAAVRLVPER